MVGSGIRSCKIGTHNHAQPICTHGRIRRSLFKQPPTESGLGGGVELCDPGFDLLVGKVGIEYHRHQPCKSIRNRLGIPHRIYEMK